MAETLYRRIKVRGGTKSAAETANEVLLQNEFFRETDTGDIKIGDGVSHYKLLPYLFKKFVSSFSADASPFMVAKDTGSFTIKGGTLIRLNIPGEVRWYEQATDIDYSLSEILDEGTVAAGKDYHIFLCPDTEGTKLVASLNSTYPAGFDATNSRKIGGMHTLCANVGTIANHPLSGFVAGSILPKSVWCLNHRPVSDPEGMVYCEATDMWVDIYNMNTSGTSVFGAARAHTITHFTASDMLRQQKKSLIGDEDFYCASKGSPQMVAVAGSAQPSPDTTGGRSATNGVRMISYIGCEEMCGLQWQHIEHVIGGGSESNVAEGNGEGSFWSARVLFAGGPWANSSSCGSRARSANYALSGALAYLGARGRSQNRRI